MRAKRFYDSSVMDTRIHSTQEFHAIVNLFEGETDIFEEETEEDLEKFFKIRKMSNQKYSKRKYN